MGPSCSFQSSVSLGRPGGGAGGGGALASKARTPVGLGAGDLLRGPLGSGGTTGKAAPLSLSGVAFAKEESLG